jgi:hypothetical protein
MYTGRYREQATIFGFSFVSIIRFSAAWSNSAETCSGALSRLPVDRLSIEKIWSFDLGGV